MNTPILEAMINSHPITPLPELVEQWIADIWHEGTPVRVAASDIHIATQAARWGADQELEACVDWMDRNSPVIGGFHLRIDRRPKPPSLKAQALEALAAIEGDFNTVGDRASTIRRALEQLND